MIAKHRGAFEYDWRARFHMPLSVVGRSMSWGEAFRLTGRLVRDTSSEVAASVAGWQHAASRDALALMDLYDAFAGANYKKPKFYPRPWDGPPKRFGSRVEDVAAVLAKHRAAVDATRKQAEGGEHG